MSEKEYLERMTREAAQRNANLTHVQPHQGDYWTRTVVNNEIDRINRAREEQARRDQQRR